MKRRVPPPREELTTPLIPPQVGDIVLLWAGARRSGGINGVPNYLDGASVRVLELLADGRFRVEVEEWVGLHLLPREPRVRVVRLDEISENLGNPKDWREEAELDNL